MAAATANTIERYQQSIWGTMDRALRNCFTGSAIIGVALLIAIFVVPKPAPEPITIDNVPERIARLILEKPKPVAPVVPVPDQVVMDTPKVKPKPEIEDKPKPPPRRRTSKPKPTTNKGTKGRQKAQQEVTQNLAQVTGSLDKALGNLSKSLQSTSDSGKDKPKPKRRRRVRSGRSTEQLASVGCVSTLSSADVSSSAIETEGISIASISDLTVQDDAGGEIPQSSRGGGSQAGGGEFRSNASLLNTVRRYAPGIQFCYDNELKRNPGLRGKLVISITVLANGKVSEVIVVEDSLKSPGVSQCVLAQIRGWQLPEIPFGVTSFRTPFVFTPPE